MSIQLIKAFSQRETEFVQDDTFLEVSEFFFDTIQGENFIGVPSAFLRLQGCTLNCTWCDTDEVWRQGNPYTIKELLKLISESPLLDKLQTSQQLVITGGSPLRQQFALRHFFERFEMVFGFLPEIEIENECTIKPCKELADMPIVWNNSPKLSNSGNSTIARYKPDVLKFMSGLEQSYFKFVVKDESDWDEIVADFLDKKLINLEQIVLMPEGATREQIIQNAPFVAEMCIKYGVRFTNREHIILWDKRTGV